MLALFSWCPARVEVLIRATIWVTIVSRIGGKCSASDWHTLTFKEPPPRDQAKPQFEGQLCLSLPPFMFLYILYFGMVYFSGVLLAIDFYSL